MAFAYQAAISAPGRKVYPSGQMLRHIEESLIFMIELAKSNNVEMDKVLNHTLKNGATLFFWASLYSENISRYLIQENVKVTSIGFCFQSPSFRVRQQIHHWKLISSSNVYDN